jgi:NAD(P)-dependent dehydrogenase (short-subunit alcohol dehydrogenase family)
MSNGAGCGQGTRGYVVTGGTGALGRAVVLHLLQQGHRVAVPFRTAPPWSELRAAADMSPALWGEPADMSDLAAAERFMAVAVEWLGQLDGVAALVGAYAGSGTFESAPLEEWDEMLRLNLGSARATCRAALPHLIAGGGGALILVSSQLARVGGSGAAAYAVAKAGVETLARVLALENRARGVRFNVVAPAIIDTPENRKALPRSEHGRLTPPEDIAAVIACLLSPESAPVTGAVIPVPGGA